MEDDIGSTSFLIFGRRAVDLISLPASTLSNSYQDHFTIPPLMAMIYEIKWIFQVVISIRNEDLYNISFKIIHIFKETNILHQEVGEKSKLNFSSSFLLHKPLARNMTNTAKISIDFGESSVSKDVHQSKKSQAACLPPQP